MASTMRRSGLLSIAAVILLASGCAVAPHGRAEPSVTTDVVDYLHREWPLTGRPVVPVDAQQGGCACCGGGANCSSGPCAAPRACQMAPACWSDDWNQPGYRAHVGVCNSEMPPAVPLDAPPPGRFFPAPVRPVFAPQGGG